MKRPDPCYSATKAPQCWSDSDMSSAPNENAMRSGMAFSQALRKARRNSLL
jgi:hypothetical protein